jgi:hypothetical protein
MKVTNISTDKLTNGRFGIRSKTGGEEVEAAHLPFLLPGASR